MENSEKISSPINNNCNSQKIILRGNIYNKEEIIEAAYLMLDRASVTITGEIGKEVIIELTAKPGHETLDLEKTFQDELIQVVHNQKQDEANAELQKTIMTSLLFSDTVSDISNNNEEKSLSDSLHSEAQAFLSDTIEDIRVEK